MPRQNQSTTHSLCATRSCAYDHCQCRFALAWFPDRWRDLLRKENAPYCDAWKGLIFLLASLATLAAAHADEFVKSHQRFQSTIKQTATENAVALSGIHALQRMEKAARMESLFDAMIRTERQFLARRSTIRRLETETKPTNIPTDRSASRPITVATVASFQDPSRSHRTSPVVTLVRPNRSFSLSHTTPMPIDSAQNIHSLATSKTAPPSDQDVTPVVSPLPQSVPVADNVHGGTPVFVAAAPNVIMNPLLTTNGNRDSASVQSNHFLNPNGATSSGNGGSKTPSPETQTPTDSSHNEIKSEKTIKLVTDIVPTQLSPAVQQLATNDVTEDFRSQLLTDPQFNVPQPQLASALVDQKDQPLTPVHVDSISPTKESPSNTLGSSPRENSDTVLESSRNTESKISFPNDESALNASSDTRAPDTAIDTVPSGVADAQIAAQWPFTLGGPQSLPAPTGDSSEVSLSVDGVDVRTVLEMLAKGYGMNILVAPDVEGTVTANVSGLTPDQTLNSVVRMCSLAIEREGNVILVYPKDNLPRESRCLRVFPLDFARAELIEPTVTGLLSPIGSAYTSVVDELDNRKGREAIVVIDTPRVITQVEQYLIQADQPPRQVMIEARVLEIELSDDMRHGVDFEHLISGDLRTGAVRLADNVFSTSNPFFFADINGSDLDAVITMLETTTDAKTLATPRVMVVNGQNARIQVGQQLGFAVATVTQTSTVQDVRFLDTGIVLSVTPTISRDNRILLQVKPKVSSGEINPDTLLPEESTREVETSVMLNNHQGMIIGGLIQEDDRVVIRKMPWLGDFKYVGKLFQRREATRSRSEVIIALIPHIVEGDQMGHYSNTSPCRDEMEWQRTDQRLFNGPLNRECRPWEPRLPDVTSESVFHRDIGRQRNRNPYSKGCEPIKTGLHSFE